MKLSHTWSSLLDDLVRMKVESDKGDVKQPMLGPFIKHAQEQQLSLAVSEPKPNNFELLFGYFTHSLSVLREKQKGYEDSGDQEKVTSMDQHLANSLNQLFTTLEILAQKEVSGE